MRNIIFIILLLSAPSYAWDGSKRGKITTIEVTNENNFAFRVHLAGAPKMCGNNNSWAFLNKGDSNYETYVSLLVAAKFAEREVTIFSDISTSGNYCRIGHIFVH